MGRCGVRENLAGILYATNHEEIAHLEVETIERVPLFHYRPGAKVLALGSLGESFPAELAPPSRPSGVTHDTRYATAAEAVDIALSRKVDAIAYAGGEPFMWLEQWVEIGAAARTAGLRNVAITNGYALPEAVADVTPLLDAVNVALLGSAAAYRKRGLEVDPVLETARSLHSAGIHIELTFTVVADLSDTVDDAREVAAIARSLGEPPLHLASPLHPDTAAPVKTMLRLNDALAAMLPYVHISNVYGSTPNTLCRACGATLIDRRGPRHVASGLTPAGTCARCGAPAPIRL